ncbi:Glutamine amidotransferase domain-containing protein [Pararobbsia alpina]|uniref:glutamine amidotransferase n=1 Tax=Pararobbsia alpina TaxID=621374 RepID=UPI0039A46604
MKEVLAIRHVAFEDLGTLEPALESAGYQIHYVDAPTHAWQGLDIETPDLVVVLGGPIGAYEDDRYPFLSRELALIEARLKTSGPLLGICLGAQLMARVAGARVYAGPEKEIGWSGVSLTEAGSRSALSPLGDGTPVLHWHGDTFDLPAGAERLASTALYANQAFSMGPRVLGLQFHLEASPQALERWLVGHAVELAHAGIDVQTLRNQAPATGTYGAAIVLDWLNAAEASVPARASTPAIV